jgi:ERCC4-type nuclease
MMFRDNIKVITTKSILETALVINAIYLRVNAEPEKYSTQPEITETSQPVVKKSGSDLPIFVKLLCQVPGISLKTAQIIASSFPTLDSFYQEMRPLDSKARMARLESLKTETGRKINKNALASIISGFFDAKSNN